MSDADDDVIRRYLLGLMPEAEAESLEDEYFARPDLLDRVRGVEDDLLDDWAAGRLPAGDKAALERRYLASGPLRQRLVAAGALRLARPASGGHARRPARRVPRWTGPLPIAAGLFLALVAAWLWRSRAPQVTTSTPPTSIARVETPSPPSPEPTAQTSPASRPSAGPRASIRVVLALSPTLLRATGEPVEVHVPPNTDTIAFELQGEASTVPRGARLGVLIETVEGARVWSGAARAARRAGVAASAEAPASRLGPGDYLLTLTAAEETVHRYFFRVTAR